MSSDRRVQKMPVMKKVVEESVEESKPEETVVVKKVTKVEPTIFLKEPDKTFAFDNGLVNVKGSEGDYTFKIDGIASVAGLSEKQAKHYGERYWRFSIF